MSKSYIEEVIEHRYRIQSLEKDSAFIMKAINSDDSADSSIERKIIALETKVKIAHRVLWMIGTAIITSVIGYIFQILK